MNVKTLLFWSIPPLAGALIGFVTNALAIKMLFRPLGEKRVFGIRLPFTPGIIPRERHKLAKSIGRMVEEELLTAGVLRERLAAPDTREKLKEAVAAYTGQTLDKALLPPPQDLPGQGIRDSLFAELLKDFAGSDIFSFFLEEVLKAWMLAENSPPREDGEGLGPWLKSRFRGLGAVFIPAARDFIRNGLVREIKHHARAGEGEGVFRGALEKTALRYPGIRLGEFLSLGGVKKRRLDAALARAAARVLDANVESALLSVDVGALVVRRIDSMDILTVEKLILDIMAGQLRWINVFGAILGALIGLLQPLLALFGLGR